MKNKMNSQAKLAHFTARKREGDVTRLVETTGYSQSHVSNVIAGRRSVPQDMANGMYNISRSRRKNSELARA